MSTTQTTTWTCPHCDKEVTGYPALSRRDNKTDICSKCGEIEAFVDMSDSLPENIIHWEFRFQQICCGDDKQSGHDVFHKFLQFRKKIGKHDKPLWEIEWLITKAMFPKAKYDVFMSKLKPQYDQIEEKWAFDHATNI